MTAELTSEEFGDFFEAVHGVRPFPWQQRLLGHLAETGAWPPILDLPTGAGKTAALDIAVFHLAMEALKEGDRRAPVRIVLVVDRRLIVDDAFLRAQRIAKALAAAATEQHDVPEAVRKVAERLGHLAECPERPLLARRLRGGVPREDDWARTPCQPTILCSTVDQVGSRLLFRGYGVSHRMTPIHAGLLGADCLILLDEAHLSRPFRETLGGVAEHLKRRRYPYPNCGCPAPFGFALLTATPGEASACNYKLEQDDYEHPLLQRRLEAPKPARLVPITKLRDGSSAGVDDERVAALAKEVGEALAHLEKQRSPAPPVIGVVVNRVLRARRVLEKLRKDYGASEDGQPAAADVVLVIGPAREADRAQRDAKLDPIKTGAEIARGSLPRPLIVVATQTIEAGVDLDFDALITEVAPLDALKQRFGRLNRAGRRFEPYAAILAHPQDMRPPKDGDPIYGERAAATWKALLALAGRRESADCVDFGATAGQVAPWIGRIPEAEARALVATAGHAPVLMPAYVDLWAQTSPVPAADPEVALFLHGCDRAPANVQIVWRVDLAEADLRAARTDHDARERLLDLFAAVPPKSGETVEVSLAAARR
jgi:CRISPR-associated endonuclease/helicase Cas3